MVVCNHDEMFLWTLGTSVAPREGSRGSRVLTLRKQDKLQALLLETEQHPTGSVARTQSLEKIRSMLLDR